MTIVVDSNSSQGTGGFTFLQLVNRLRQFCGASGASAALVTTANQSGESARMVNWINEAWLDIQTMRRDWLWARKTAAFPTVSGKAVYSSTDIGLTDFGHWARDTFRNYANPQVAVSIGSPGLVTLADNRLSAGDAVTVFTDGALPTGLTAGLTCYVLSPTTDTFQLALTAGGAAINTSGTQSGTHTITSDNTSVYQGLRSEVFMDYLEYDDWRDAYQFGALRQVQTRPLVVSITSDKSLALGPFPIAGYTVVGDYYSAPYELVNDTDIPLLPARYHYAIVYKAMVAYGMYESASEVVQRGQAELEKWLRRMSVDQLPEVTTGTL